MKRNYGIDLLRMVLMLMVVILHLLGHGGVLKATAPLTIKYGGAWLVECLAFCAVNCYALVSGYVCINSKFKFSSLFQICLQTFLYSIGIAACVWILKPELFSLQNLTKFLFPISNGGYWYVSAYFGMYMLIPLLNMGVHALSKERAKAYILLLFFVFTLLPTLAGRDVFSVNSGYSTFWLAFLYVIGACIKKFGWGDNLKSYKALLIYFCSVLLSWGTKIGCEGITTWQMGESKTWISFITYTSPTMVIASIAILVAFKNAKISPKSTGFISAFSPAAFGVYLIHEHYYVRKYCIASKFVFLTEYSTPVMIIGIFVSALVIFTGCLFIDWIRLKVFRWLRVKECFEKLEEKLIHSSTAVKK